MDPAQLAQSVGGFVAPFVPYLLKAGEKAAEEAGEKMGDDAWEKARALWGKLQGRRAVEAAARDLADRPHDPDAQAALRWQLKKLLAEDQALAREVARLMEDSVVQRVLAERDSVVRRVEQMAEGGETRQKVIARDGSTVEGVRQVRRS